MATYAIGDLQGCFKQLQHLIELIGFTPSRDKLWFVGDIVNRGPDSLDLLRFLSQFENSVTIVLGNHDLHLLLVAEEIAPQREAIPYKQSLKRLIVLNYFIGFGTKKCFIPKMNMY